MTRGAKPRGRDRDRARRPISSSNSKPPCSGATVSYAPKGTASKLSSPFMTTLSLLLRGSGKHAGTRNTQSSSALMAHEGVSVFQCVHAAADVGPSVQGGDQETDGSAEHVSCRVQNGSDTETQQLAIKPFRIGARNGLQCLNWKQPAQRGKADLKQTVAEMAHEFRKTTPQTVALLLIDGERALRRANGREGRRAAVNSGPAQVLELCNHLGVAGENRERRAEAFGQGASQNQLRPFNLMPGRCSSPAEAVRAVLRGAFSQDSQRLRVVNDEISVPLPDQLQIVRQRCRPGGRGANAVRDDNRTRPWLFVIVQKRFQRSRVMRLEYRGPNTLRRRPLNAPACDRVNPCVGVDRDTIIRQHIEQIPVKVEGRGREHSTFTAQQLCQILCHSHGLRRRFERRRPACRELRPWPQRVVGMTNAQVEHRCEVEHDLLRLALSFPSC